MLEYIVTDSVAIYNLDIMRSTNHNGGGNKVNNKFLTAIFFSAFLLSINKTNSDDKKGLQ